MQTNIFYFTQDRAVMSLSQRRLVSEQGSYLCLLTSQTLMQMRDFLALWKPHTHAHRAKSLGLLVCWTSLSIFQTYKTEIIVFLWLPSGLLLYLFAVEADGDNCYSVICQNGGTCKDGYRNYTCQCLPNFNGTLCENDLASGYL